MEFKRFGKSFQMVINNGVDMEEALTLDESLWVALSAPASAIKFDPKVAEFLDTRKTGRITSTDLRTGVKWLLDQLPDHKAIVPEFDGKLKIADISKTSADGPALIDAAQWIIHELKPADTTTITIQQVREFLATVTSRALNGDGVLTAKAATAAATPELQAKVAELVQNVVAATGGAKDLDGTLGLDKATLDAFMAAVPQYLDWHDKGVIPEGQKTTEIMTMGPDTPALAALVAQNAPKVDLYFRLSKLLAFDERLAPKALSTPSKVDKFDPALQAEVDEYATTLPIASPQLDCVLQLAPEKINPAYRAWFAELETKVIRPIIGEGAESITQPEWEKIKATFAPYQAYLAAKAGACVEKIALSALRQYKDCQPLLDEVARLIELDKDVANKATAARLMEKLILYRGALLKVMNNFVSFTDLYAPDRRAMFECGKLVIDGRWFNIAFEVEAPAAHQAVAKNSQLFLMYLDVTRSNGTKFSVCVPVTSGSKGSLAVGKRGIFYDLNGNDCNAVITSIQENPVCIREALMAPIYRLWGIVEGKITAWSGNAEKNLQGNFTKALTPQTPPPAPAPAKPDAKGESKVNANAFMGIGIAAAAIGSALAFITKTLAGMTGLQIWIAVIVAILALMLPVSLIAIIKLNRQDLSAVLEGGGWGINMRLRLDTKLRNQFTYFGKFPTGAKGTPRSYCLKLIAIIIVAILIAWGGFKAYQYSQELKEARQQQIEQEAKTAAAEAKTAAAEKATADAEAKTAAAEKALQDAKAAAPKAP